MNAGNGSFLSDISHDRRFIADESELEFPTDNVYFMNDFCYRRCTLEEGLKDLRAHYEVS